jgi:hypothetical protein
MRVGTARDYRLNGPGAGIIYSKGANEFFVAVVFNIFCSRIPRYIFSSNLYPKTCCINQVIHSL